MRRMIRRFSRRAFALLAIAALLVCSAAPALAADPPAEKALLPAFSLTPVSCKPGEEVLVFLRIYYAAGLEAGSVEIAYDTSLLEFVNYEEPEDAALADVFLMGGQPEPGNVSVVFLHVDQVAREHDRFSLAKIVFKAKAEGKGKLSLNVFELETAGFDGDVAKKIRKVTAKVSIGNNMESRLLASDNGADLDWSNMPIPEPGNAGGSYGTLMLVGSVVVVAAVGVMVIVSVLKRKKTDVNPNKIDVKK